jgi:large subunit ribosomal protein L6
MEKAITIPNGIEAKLSDGFLVIKGPKGELSRKIASGGMKIKIDEGRIKLASTDDRKKNRSIVGAWVAHVRNMITGVSHGWEVRMKIVYSHFPIKLSIDGKTVVIGNYLGERGNRETTIVEGATVKIEKDEVLVTGIDKEAVGQTAANIELASRVKNRDKRVFQDGVYMLSKPKASGK